MFRSPLPNRPARFESPPGSVVIWTHLPSATPAQAELLAQYLTNHHFVDLSSNHYRYLRPLARTDTRLDKVSSSAPLLDISSPELLHRPKVSSSAPLLDISSPELLHRPRGASTFRLLIATPKPLVHFRCFSSRGKLATEVRAAPPPAHEQTHCSLGSTTFARNRIHTRHTRHRPIDPFGSS